MSKKFLGIALITVILISIMSGCAINVFKVFRPLLFYYTFDSVEGGKIKDASGNHFDASVSAVNMVPGKVGNAFNFSIPGAIVALPLHVDSNGVYNYLPDNKLTLCAWIRLTNINPELSYHIVGTSYSETTEWGSFYLRVNNSKIEYAMCATPTWYSIVQSTETLTTGAWYYIVLTYDGNNAILYINGIQDNSNSLILSFSPFINGISIGGTEHGCNFDGEIDELKIYNSVLSSAEILDYYNLTKLRH